MLIYPDTNFHQSNFYHNFLDSEKSRKVMADKYRQASQKLFQIIHPNASIPSTASHQSKHFPINHNQLIYQKDSSLSNPLYCNDIKKETIFSSYFPTRTNNFVQSLTTVQDTYGNCLCSTCPSITNLSHTSHCSYHTKNKELVVIKTTTTFSPNSSTVISSNNPNSIHPTDTMLNRTSSGAARRIHQRKQQQEQAKFPVLSSPGIREEEAKSNTSSLDTMIDDGGIELYNEEQPYNYRNIQNSNSYVSLLNDDFDINYSRPPTRILCSTTPTTQSLFLRDQSSEMETKIDTNTTQYTSCHNLSDKESLHSDPIPNNEHQLINSISNKFLKSLDITGLMPSNLNELGNDAKSITPPVPPKRNSLALSSPTMSSASSTNIFTNVNYHISKPTIEVHPMPAPRKNSNALTYSSADSSPSSTLDKGVKKIPPPVPRKPAKFTFKATSATSFTATNDDSLINSTKDHCMDNDNISKDDYGIKQDPNIIGKARFDSMPSLLINNPQHYTGNNNNKENEKTFSKSFMKTDNNNAFSMSASTSNLYNGHTGLTNTMYSAQSSESLNQLYRSPSLVSLQNAFRNTQLMNEQEIDELEEKRKLTIETLKKKMHILEIEQENINQDVIGNENIKNHLFKTSHIDETILKKLNNHVNQSKTLVLLETKVKLKLDKLNGILSDHDESEFCKTRRARLEEQLEDSKILRNYHCDRDIELDNIIYPNYLSQDEMANWRFYKETLWKLLVEKMHVNDRLIYSKHQLLALEQIGTQSDLLMRYHHRQTSSGASSLTSDKIVHKSHELADPISSCIV